MTSPPLVALRANDVCFLGILRSCGIAGIPVLPLVFDWPGGGPWFSEASRYYHDPVTIPNPPDDEAGAIAALIELGKRLTDEHDCRLLIVPSSDTNLMLLQNHFEALAPYYLQMGATHFSSPRFDIIRKDALATTLQEAGIPLPHSVTSLSERDIEPAVTEAVYPCLCKPTQKDYTQSFQRRHDMSKAIECATPGQLRAALTAAIADGYELIVQEIIEFDRPEDETSFYLYADADSDIRMACCATKEGEFPPRYGTGTLVRLGWVEELLPLAQRIVEVIAWRGMMEIEFIRDRKDGCWKIIEANPRPWLFHHHTALFGLNFIECLYRDAYGDLPGGDLPGGPPSSPLVAPSPALLAARPLHVNFAWAVAQLVADEADADQLLTNLAAWLNGLDGTVTFSYLDADDPEPGLRELEHLAREHGLDPDRILQLFL